MRHRPIRLTALFLGVLLLATACASAPAPFQSRSLDAAAPTSAPASAPGIKYSSGTAAGEANSLDLASPTSQSADRMVIRTAYVQLIVNDVGDTIDKVSKLAQDMGGYVVSTENQQQGTERIGKTSIRVPPQRLDESLKAIRGMAVRIGRESSTSKDVSEEYVDQDARVRALRAAESAYLDLMKNAKTTSDIITIQQSLTQIRQQIEQTQGRMQYLQRSSEMAIINMDIMTAGAARPISSGEWNLQDVTTMALQALTSVALILASMVIWVVVFVPAWGPVLLVIRWWILRDRRMRSSPPPQPINL